MSRSVPVCSPSLVEDRSVTEGIAEDERMNSRGFVSVFSKFLGQKASQRSPEQMNLVINKQKAAPETPIHPDRGCYFYKLLQLSLTTERHHQTCAG